MKPEAVTSAVSADNLEIPLIDFDSFLSGDEATRKSTAQDILFGFQNAGFIYLKNHPISKATVEKTFVESAKFFKRPREEKNLLAWTTPAANRGYSKPGLEKVTNLMDKDDIAKEREEVGEDLKESFEIGLDSDPAYDNQWPDRFDEEGKIFKDHMLDFFEQCKEVHVQVMRSIAIGMGLDETWFDGFTQVGDNTLRLLHYPEVNSAVFKQNKNQVRAGAHTFAVFDRLRYGVDLLMLLQSDYGSITLLFQDSSGGLQVMSPNGNFIDATPIADTIVVNAGDLLARWSNDTIKSTKHQVVEPPTPADVHPARYSIAYFCNPDFDRIIEAIPGTFDDARGKKYEPIKSGDYLVQRLAATY